MYMYMNMDDDRSPLSGAPPNANGMSKFPAFSPDATAEHQHESPFPRRSSSVSRGRDYSPGKMNGAMDADRWQARRNSRTHFQWPRSGAGWNPPAGARHGRQKSLSEAIRTIRRRSGSMSQNAHEIADALKAPIEPKLIFFCAAWYVTSIIANTSAGQILKTFAKPVTLTTIQFMLVASCCVGVSWLASTFPSLKHHIPALRMGIRRPTRELIMTTLPLTGFMIGGHILTSDAMSRIPVSLVHTIKGLSPLFTVIAYRFVFNIRYSLPVYASLIPLTIGVIMACSTTFSDNFLGLCSAFASAILFVTQNIVSKKLFNEAAIAEQEGSRSRKPDKLNLLCYSSALAFVFTFPIWLWSEGFSIVADIWSHGSVTLSSKAGTLDHGRLVFEYVFNGTFHFAQSLVAFQLLSMVSPVTYSVASLIKRVFVICFAILWFGNQITQVQGFGIALTFLGLYLYDRTHDAAKADRKARQIGIRPESMLLPLHEKPFESPPLERNSPNLANGYPYSDEKKYDAAGPGRPEANFTGWLPPGTKADETWNNRDVVQAQAPGKQSPGVS